VHDEFVHVTIEPHPAREETGHICGLCSR
jgi:hypothetical protein